jgi:hypothetical protein
VFETYVELDSVPETSRETQPPEPVAIEFVNVFLVNESEEVVIEELETMERAPPLAADRLPVKTLRLNVMVDEVWESVLAIEREPPLPVAVH